MNPNDTIRRIRFGPFEADFETRELRKHGIKLKLTGQPLQVLEILVARPGQLVSRADLQQQLWPGQVFVDSSHGLNAAVNKLREALNDSSSEPKYIETLPRRGYRFIGSLETALAPVKLPLAPRVCHEVRAQSIQTTGITAFATPAADAPLERARLWVILPTAAALAFCLIGLIVFTYTHSNRSGSVQRQPRKLVDEKYASAPLSSRQESSSVAPAIDDRNPMPRGKGWRSSPRLRRVIWGDGGNAGPQFSPDGRRIAFMSNRNGPWQIWISDANGDQPRQVSFTESAGTPRWSPDGRSIAFDAPFDGSTWIYTIRVDQGEHARPIVEGLVPSFSRDGKWIYFASERTGDWQVWKTSVVDGSEVQVTFHGGFAALESTDGYLYYSKSRYPQPELCRIRIQGGQESCGFQHLRPRTWASWAPTREGIVFAEDLPNGQATLSLYDPNRRQVRDLVSLQSAPFWVGASVDGKRAIMNDSAEQQISLVENLH